MTLATTDSQGRPSARVVLLKEVDERGFVFYTNSQSRKGAELKATSVAALVFFWDGLDHQIRVEGTVEQVSEKEADDYWVTRPRDSQIGAWASLQSQQLDRRSTFLKRIARFALQFSAKKVPRPPHWYGFRVVPFRLEFWKKKPFRLHERECYEKTGSKWTQYYLYP